MAKATKLTRLFNFTDGTRALSEQVNMELDQLIAEQNNGVDDIGEIIETAAAAETKSDNAVADASGALNTAATAEAKADTAIDIANGATVIAVQAEDKATEVYLLKPELEQALDDASVLIQNLEGIIDETIFDRVGATTLSGQFTSPDDGTVGFTVPIGMYNPSTDYLAVIYKNHTLKEGDNYIRNGRTVTTFPLAEGDVIYYRITKNVLLDPTIADGRFLMNDSVYDDKLSNEPGQIKSRVPIQSETEPENPTPGTLWLDKSDTPAEDYVLEDYIQTKQTLNQVNAELGAHKAENVADGAHGMGSIASETYEEGEWTPSLNFNFATTGITYATQTGIYTKVGRLVHVSFEILLTSKGTATGNARISGLPFPAKNIRGVAVPLTVNLSRGSANDVILSPEGGSINLFTVTSGGATGILNNGNFANDTRIRCEFMYTI